MAETEPKIQQTDVVWGASAIAREVGLAPCEALLEQVEKKHLTLNCYNMHVVTKAELAEELRVSRPRVSQFIDRGLPVRPDGRIDLKIACDWIVANCEPGRAVAEAREWLWLLNRPRSASPEA